MAQSCIICERPLNRSQYKSNKAWKSCPSCSTQNGRQHVFRPYPAAFGTSTERMSDGTPDGAQSWCSGCRGSGFGDGAKKVCEDFAPVKTGAR